MKYPLQFTVTVSECWHCPAQHRHNSETADQTIKRFWNHTRRITCGLTHHDPNPAQDLHEDQRCRCRQSRNDFPSLAFYTKQAGACAVKNSFIVTIFPIRNTCSHLSSLYRFPSFDGSNLHNCLPVPPSIYQINPRSAEGSIKYPINYYWLTLYFVWALYYFWLVVSIYYQRNCTSTLSLKFLHYHWFDLTVNNGFLLYYRHKLRVKSFPLCVGCLYVYN